MARDSAIAVVSRALVGLLEDACPRTRFPSAAFRLVQATDLEGNARPVDQGVTVYLFRTLFSTSRRTLPPRTDAQGRRFRASVPVDLQYLVTAWAADVEQQQRLLGWAIRTLDDNPILPAGFLNRFVPGGENVFSEAETVELLGDQLSLQDLYNVWDVAGHRHQPSVPYTIRQLALESARPLSEHPAVQTREFVMGVMDQK
jgi:Pvc16 N-terminal domain